MQSLNPEQLEALDTNGRFALEFRVKLTETLSDLDTTDVLDYGAGAIPTPVHLFSGIHPHEKIVAYDPASDIEKVFPRNPTIWVNTEPEGDFDIIICNFSLHHMGQSPRRLLEHIKGKYRSKYIAIADYNLPGVSLDEFKATFIADMEQRELQQLYNGDITKCLEEHSRYGEGDYQKALEENGYSIRAVSSQKGYGGHKFFLIAELHERTQ
jgi:hypothetical protein